MTTQHPHNNSTDDDAPPAMSGFDLGLNFIVSILLCAGGGFALDKWLNTLPLFMLLGFFFGFAAGLYVIWQKIKSF